MVRTLPKIQPHRYSKFLRGFEVARVAKRVGCSTNYMYQVLSGCYRPSPHLDKKLQDLVKELKK